VNAITCKTYKLQKKINTGYILKWYKQSKRWKILFLMSFLYNLVKF